MRAGKWISGSGLEIGYRLPCVGKIQGHGQKKSGDIRRFHLTYFFLHDKYDYGPRKYSIFLIFISSYFEFSIFCYYLAILLFGCIL